MIYQITVELSYMSQYKFWCLPVIVVSGEMKLTDLNIRLNKELEERKKIRIKVVQNFRTLITLI